MSLEDRLVPKGGEVDKLLDRYNLMLEVGSYSVQPKFNHRKLLHIRVRDWNDHQFKKLDINLDKSDEEIQEYLIKHIKIFLTKQLLET